MKRANSLIVFFLISFNLFIHSQLYAKEDSLFVKTVGDTIQIWNTNIWANCASKFTSSIEYLDSNKIVITERDTIGSIANCMCYFDLEISLGGLAVGQYTVSVYRQELKKYFYHKDTTIFIGELNFSLENPLLVSYPIQLYQSECHSLEEETHTAQYWYAEANTACQAIHDSAKLRTIFSDDVLFDGKATRWNYKFSWFDQSNNRMEYLYFHNEQGMVLFDSVSLEMDCCVMLVTEEWFDSDSALAYAESAGGETFRGENPNCIIKASLYQALVPYSYPCWSVTYLSRVDTTRKFSLSFDARRNPSEQISFSPDADTLFLMAGGIIPRLSFHLGNIGTADDISLEPDLNTLILVRDSLGNFTQVDNSHFLIIHPVGEYEYEIWYHPYPPYDGVLVPFDSVFYFQQYNSVIQLIVKLNGVPIDSLSQFFISEYGLDVKSDNVSIYEFDLLQNYPNPFNPSTNIEFRIAEFGFVSIKVYDVLGKEVANLVNEEKPAGTYEIKWNAGDHPSGVYFYKIKTGDFVQTKKMILLK